MMAEPTKNKMKLAERRLATMMEKRPEPDIMATFRGIDVSEFDHKALVEICNLFADKWHDAEEKYIQAISKLFDRV